MASHSKTEDRFYDLRKLSEVSCLSVNTLKNHMCDPVTPLPHFKVGGKTLIRWVEFVRWVETFRVEGQNLDDIIEEVTRELQ